MSIDTEELILKTARKHFVQHGFAATRMQEIADDAGINKAMLHYYFRTKDKLYQEIVEQTLNQMVPKFAEAFASEGDFWERLELFLDTYISTLLEHPHIPIFILSEITQKRERFVEAIKKRAAFIPAVKAFVLQMSTEMQEGSIKSMPPMQLFLNIISMTVFPFIAKPMYMTVFDFPEESFASMMEERKQIIMDFTRSALRVGGKDIDRKN